LPGCSMTLPGYPISAPHKSELIHPGHAICDAPSILMGSRRADAKVSVAILPPSASGWGTCNEGMGIMPPKYVEPFYLIVIDKKDGAFSVEGPMTDDRPWNHAVVIAQRSGRQVRCATATGSSSEDIARDWLQWHSGNQVLSGEIVHL
jgi:hypothetical protein